MHPSVLISTDPPLVYPPTHPTLNRIDEPIDRPLILPSPTHCRIQVGTMVAEVPPLLVVEFLHRVLDIFRYGIDLGLGWLIGVGMNGPINPFDR